MEFSGSYWISVLGILLIMPIVFLVYQYLAYLCECLLVLAVLEGVDEGVDDGRHPGQDGGDGVQQREPHLVVVGHVHHHQRQEADLKCRVE